MTETVTVTLLDALVEIDPDDVLEFLGDRVEDGSMTLEGALEVWDAIGGYESGRDLLRLAANPPEVSWP